jgi:hypothetical protein
MSAFSQLFGSRGYRVQTSGARNDLEDGLSVIAGERLSKQLQVVFEVKDTIALIACHFR